MAESTGQPGPPRPEDLPSADVADAKLVAHRLEEATKDVEVQRRWYWTNLSFVMGEQWVWWDRDRNVVDYVPQTYSPLGRGRTRLTVNRMKPNYVTLLARLTKRALTFESAATGADDATLMAAHLADAVLAHLHREQSWEEQRVNELMAAILGSTSAVSVEWDGRAGRTLEIDPTTNKFVGTGEARLESLSINNFALERGVRSVEEARYWIRDVGLPPPTVKDHYKLDWTPQPDVGPKMSALQHRLLQDSGRESGRTLTRVITMYERPHGGSKGQIVTVVNNVVVDRRPWIFPFNHLNLVTFRQLPLDERWTGDTFMNDAIRIQAAYNFARSATSENMKLVGNPRLMYQHGQIHASQLRGDSPGDSLVYTAGFDGGKPDYLRPPDMPRWVSNEAGQLAAELDDIMHTHATSRGDVTFDRASGQALALLTEKDDSPLGIMAKDQQRGWSRLASMVLELYESKATERRSLNVTDDVDRHVAAVDWIGKDLRGQTNVHVPLESAMPSSPTAMMAFAREMWDRGAIKDITHFAKVAGLPLRDYTKVLDPDTARAQWENKRLLNGWAEVAEEFDNHAKHISEHNAARKSTAYRFADKKSRELIDGHIVMHQELALAEQEKQAALDEVQPGLSEVPQGAEPLGGSVPPSQQELEAAAASGLVPELGGPMAELQPNGAGGGLQNPTIPPGAATV